MTPELSRLATELTSVIDDAAAAFGAAAPTVSGELDCDPTRPGHLTCWQYGVRVDHPASPSTGLATLLPTLHRDGWQSHDRSTPREQITRFTRDGADFTVHVAAAVTIIGSTRPVPA
ncbi:hypothetical protein SAMN04489727_2949 [Amycolatopsis tolypomycina]|uniref:Uncharacterized protein n=1 Tax=Amycolatopsis tolypomycina TaxID=208445 RepID=A0A1H4QM80_9PSEU|nr:hypothetical protein [Amycolatopsis tolypomycina]SEC20733.1 hypothetical protein SAMN04489727_2949 [Amycolatopsis tolypomycina]